MDIDLVRKLIRDGKIEIEFSIPHAIVEARKDGLTEEDLTRAVMTGEIVENYGGRILLLYLTTDFSDGL